MQIPRVSAAQCRRTASITARKLLKKAGAILFWLLLWQLGAMLANRTLLLPIPTPVDTACALWRMAGQGSFWLAAGLSLLRIGAGFIIAALVGALCALASVRWPLFQWLMAPLLQLIRAIPVAVFTILVFLWVSRPYIPSSIVLLTVLPVVWSNLETGLRHADPQLAEMARVFGMREREILRRIILPQLRPYAAAALSTGLGFAWKSGIAAEVICRTQGSLGDLLWSGKSSVSYDEVFALTVVIVLCSSLLQGAARKEARHAAS